MKGLSQFSTFINHLQCRTSVILTKQHIYIMVEHLHLCTIYGECFCNNCIGFKARCYYGRGLEGQGTRDSPSLLSPCPVHLATHKGQLCGHRRANSRTGNKKNTTTHPGVKLYFFPLRDGNQIRQVVDFYIALLANSAITNI
jgi:hypothetical protein